MPLAMQLLLVWFAVASCSKAYSLDTDLETVPPDVLDDLFRPHRVKAAGGIELYVKGECPLVHSFYNFTAGLTVEHQALLLSWIDDIQSSILTDWEMKPPEKLLAVSQSLKSFFTRHPDLQDELLDEHIGRLGSVRRMLELSI